MDIITLKKKLFQNTASFLFILVLCLPLLVLVHEASGVPEPSQTAGRYTRPLLMSFSLAVTVSILCGVVSALAVWALSNLPPSARKMFARILPLSLLFPPFIGAITYIELFKSPPLLAFLGSSARSEFIQAVWVLVLFLYPYVFLPMYSRIQMIHPAHAKILALYHLSWWQKARLYYIPHLQQVVVNSLLLVFIYVSADFGAVSILRIPTATTAIYEEMILRAGRAEASFISILLLALVAIITFYGRALVGNNRGASTHPPMPSPPGKHTRLGIAIILIICIFSIVLPASRIFIWMASYVQDTSTFKNIWVQAKYSLLQVSLQTLWIAVLATLTTVSLAYLYCAVKMKTLINRASAVSQLAAVIHAAPGIVAAFSVVSLKQYLPLNLLVFWVIFLYAYFLRFAGIAFIILEPAFRSLAPQIIKIGDTYITDPIEYVKKIILPTTRPALLHSANYIFFNAVRELNIPLLLLPLGVEVLSLRIWQTASVGLYTYTAPAICILLLISVPSVLLYIKERI